MYSLKKFFNNLTHRGSIEPMQVTHVSVTHVPRAIRLRLVTDGKISYCVTARMTEDLYDVIRHFANSLPYKAYYTDRVAKLFTLYHNEKPLSKKNIALEQYNLHDGDTIRMVYHGLLGGSQSKILLPTYTHIYECEQQVLSAPLQLQSEVNEDTQDDISFTMKYLKKLCEGNQFLEPEYVHKLAEDIIFFYQMICKAQSTEDYWQAFVTFLKFRSAKAVYTVENANKFVEYFKQLFSNSDFTAQSEASPFSPLLGLLGKFDELKKSPIYKKLYKLCLYALTFSVFEKLGLTFSLFNFTKMEEAAIRSEMHLGPSFIYSVAQSLIFICERGYQCLRTGSLDPLFHSGNQYEKWYNEAMELKRKSHLLHCPEEHGFTEYDFRMDLDSHIAKGNSIHKHAIRIGSYEKKMVGSVVNDLMMIRDDQTTKRAAQKERKAPFTVLLYGGSSIGKTTLTDMLFLQYGKTFDLPLGSEYKYTRNPNAEFWDGFTTAQWFVIMDDVAFMNPSIASAGGDPTVMETIQTNNRVAFVPNQASLDDKGRTAFKARCVVATTNCEDLNAVAYFQTPLAMQRRFPYIIDVTVKPEFAKDACMLDSSKSQYADGEWPNWWNFLIKRPVPVEGERRGQRAKIEVVDKFDDVDDFLAWFSKEAIKHDHVQDVIEDSSKKMLNYTLCKDCYRLEHKCKCLSPQSGIWSATKRSFKKGIFTTVMSVAQTETFSDLVHEALNSERVVGRIEQAIFTDLSVADTEEFQDDIEEDTYISRFFTLGEEIKDSIGYPEILGMTVAACGVILAGYTLYKTMDNMFKSPCSMSEQTTKSSEIGTAPIPTGDEKENVWFQDKYEMSSFDISQRAISYKSLNRDQLISIFKHNVVFYMNKYVDEKGDAYKIPGRALCIGGHNYISSSHCFPDVDTFTMNVVTGKVCDGVSENISIMKVRSEITRCENDLCYFTLDCLPPRRDISELFISERNKSTMRGFMISRTEQGELEIINLQNITRKGSIKAESLKLDQTWHCYPQRLTASGECGSAYIAETPMGPQILGLHTAGNAEISVSSVVTYEIIKEIKSKLFRPIVQSATPLISSTSAKREVGDLCRKSPFRYIESGTAAVHGSFTGWRSSHKTSVVPSILQEAVIEEGYELKHGKPVMRGWEPWRVAALDMVKPVTKLDGSIVKQCTDSFIKDILEGLPKGALDDIMVYDDKTTLNGAPGVAYVDKMNRNTSMGAPWNKSKKHFLLPLPADDRFQNPVEFTQEVKDRVNTIIDSYKAGERYMPVFKGQLKDEALPFRKIKSKKTRVFTGAPGDWSFVVRKYLLSCVRVIQNNSFIFETAVGINAHSTKWGKLRDYLVQFGEDNMIAGDYGRFDKTMPPIIILAAFDILAALCKAGGYTMEELLIVQGIAEDTAFPLIDFNGDLVEFYGSNPSGHPLTVIINSLANSIYMRYCYTVLSPDKSCTHFKRDVALMTYGDDNAMGVNHLAPFFNHTMIQEVLAKCDIVYTMADKEAESVPYIHIDQISFLKRFWVWNNEVGAYLAPLEEDSITKSLTFVVASKTLTPEAQAIETIGSAQCEYFFHGKEIFEEKTQMLQRLISKADIQVYVKDSTFHTWDEMVKRFWENSQ